MKRQGAVCIGLLGLAALGASVEPVGDATPPTVLEIVQSAFDRMLNYPSVRTIHLHIHREERVTRRSFEVVYKKVEGMGHTLLRFIGPEYLRGSGLLMIERLDGTSDTWLYQRSARRPRRVSTSQKSDSFYGSDLTFEDLEHNDWRRFQLRRLPDILEQGRSTYVVEAHARHESQYSRMRIHVEKKRLALLRVDFYQAGSADPIKSLVIRPEDIVENGAWLEPRRLWIRQHGRDAGTEVEFARIESDKEIMNQVFSTMRLEQGGTSLYDLVRRLEDAR